MDLEKESIIKGLKALKEKTPDVFADVFGENGEDTPAKRALLYFDAFFAFAMPGNPAIRYKGEMYAAPENSVKWWQDTLINAIEKDDPKFLENLEPLYSDGVIY